MEPAPTTPTASATHAIVVTVCTRLRRLPRLVLPVIGSLAALAMLSAPLACAQDSVMSGVLAMNDSQASALTVAAPHQAQQAPLDAAARQRVESRISRAETNFQLGLDEYRAANAAGHPDSVTGREHLRQAKAYFLLAKDDLERALPAYGDTAAPADDERRLDAVALRAYNERLLLSVERAEEP